MKIVFRACSGCVLIVILTIAALYVMEVTAFGEPRQTLPAGLCSGEIVSVVGGAERWLIEYRVGMNNLSLFEWGSAKTTRWRLRDESSSQWGTAVVESQRKIRVHFRDGRERLYTGPGLEVFRVAWSPDGRFIAYTYKFGVFGSGSVQSENHAIGILDLTSGTNYRLSAKPIGPVRVDQQAHVQWVP